VSPCTRKWPMSNARNPVDTFREHLSEHLRSKK
jgi:hypothetical protein